MESIKLATQGEYKAKDVDVSKNIFSVSLMCIYGRYIFLLLFVIPWMAAILGRSKSWWLGGVIGFVLALILFFF